MAPKLWRPPPPLSSKSGCQTDREAGTSSLPHPQRCHQGNTSGNISHRNPFSPQQHWCQSPALSIHPSIHPPLLHNKAKSSLPFSFHRGSASNLRHSQCTHAHLRQFFKVPVYLLSGRCPQNIMHHTYKLFTHFLCVSFVVLFFFFFSFFVVFFLCLFFVFVSFFVLLN